MVSLKITMFFLCNFKIALFFTKKVILITRGSNLNGKIFDLQSDIMSSSLMISKLFYDILANH